ncbi:uncharacterized protein ColSpa_08835 [Colletotrichum spaethianum]|uniref:Uncharacterized protein n=1 Tax=Colletotrichum spaethianum TaxID=700344 RepID=A0AA37PAH9_9PEZI|nr:uncharacterized protein ColSpa_08835 [Colletotrichum spaethianum]GKT48654.1 hypothetical protein ColSpa_08835 [Colletotrichum spaethianum]
MEAKPHLHIIGTESASVAQEIPGQKETGREELQAPNIRVTVSKPDSEPGPKAGARTPPVAAAVCKGALSDALWSPARSDPAAVVARL